MTAGAAIATHGIRARYPAGAARTLGAAATARATGTASTARLTRGGRIRARGACNTCTAIAAKTTRSTVAIETGNTACTATRTGVTPQATAAAERAGFSILTRRDASSTGVANATRAAVAAIAARTVRPSRTKREAVSTTGATASHNAAEPPFAAVNGAVILQVEPIAIDADATLAAGPAEPAQTAGPAESE